MILSCAALRRAAGGGSCLGFHHVSYIQRSLWGVFMNSNYHVHLNINSNFSTMKNFIILMASLIVLSFSPGIPASSGSILADPGIQVPKHPPKPKAPTKAPKPKEPKKLKPPKQPRQPGKPKAPPKPPKIG